MTQTKIQGAREFAVAAAQVAIDRRCNDIAVLDLRGLSPATDYFVIATGTSDRQIRTVADEISQAGPEFDMKRFGRAGYENSRWVLLDFVEVVVHLFDKQYREYYDLEMLWGDAQKVDFEKELEESPKIREKVQEIQRQ